MSIEAFKPERPIDMNGHRIENLPQPMSDHDPVRRSDISQKLVSVEWQEPSSESSNSIEVSAKIYDSYGDDFDTDVVDMEIVVTDGASDYEPSETAILTAANSPVGIVLSGSGTATLNIRSQGGSVKFKVTEPGTAHRYIWLRGSGHCRAWPRSTTGVLELQFI